MSNVYDIQMNNTYFSNILNKRNENKYISLLEQLEKIEKNNYLGFDLYDYKLVHKYDSEFETLKLDEPVGNLHLICNLNSKFSSHFQKYFEYFGFKNLKIRITEENDGYEGNPEGEIITGIIKITYKNFSQETVFNYCCNDMEGDNLLWIFNSFIYDYVNSSIKR